MQRSGPKCFNMMNKITYLMILFTTVFILQTGTGIISLPAAFDDQDMYQSQTVDRENRHMIRTADHSMDEHALQNSMSSYRVIFRQALKQYRGNPCLHDGVSDLNMPLNVYVILFGGGIFLLFLFLTPLPRQFCIKLNITHKSDGKKRPW